jgi:hypothetical protein
MASASLCQAHLTSLYPIAKCPGVDVSLYEASASIENKYFTPLESALCPGNIQCYQGIKRSSRSLCFMQIVVNFLQACS